MEEETLIKAPKIHVITWTFANEKWYLEGWNEKMNTFQWCKNVVLAQGFESVDSALNFATQKLGSRTIIDIEPTNIEVIAYILG